jgi:hypothetical protein
MTPVIYRLSWPGTKGDQHLNLVAQQVAVKYRCQRFWKFSFIIAMVNTEAKSTLNATERLPSPTSCVWRKVVLHEHLYRSAINHWCHNVTKLWHNQSIQGPCDRAQRGCLSCGRYVIEAWIIRLANEGHRIIYLWMAPTSRGLMNPKKRFQMA